jgi:hypothetical protein
LKAPTLLVFKYVLLSDRAGILNLQRWHDVTYPRYWY